MQQRVIIVHGWWGSPEEPALAWLRKNLEANGFVVLAPLMPHPDEPTIKDWVGHLNNVAGQADENTFFIGHSIGAPTILRYLETLPKNIRVGGVLFIAGWFELTGLETKEEQEIALPWFETPIDFEKVKQHTTKFTAIFSDNDPFVPLTNKAKFEKLLNAKTLVEHHQGHFDPASNVKEIPIALKAFLEMAKNT